jgi:quinol monooxygenase YgiN
MYKSVFTFEVDPAKQGEYLKVTAEKIKPYWETHGCQSYNVWQMDGGNTFIKEMLFEDVEEKDKLFGFEDDEADAMRKLWRSFMDDYTLKFYIQKV